MNQTDELICLAEFRDNISDLGPQDPLELQSWIVSFVSAFSEGDLPRLQQLFETMPQPSCLFHQKMHEMGGYSVLFGTDLDDSTVEFLNLYASTSCLVWDDLGSEEFPVEVLNSIRTSVNTNEKRYYQLAFEPAQD